MQGKWKERREFLKLQSLLPSSPTQLPPSPPVFPTEFQLSGTAYCLVVGNTTDPLLLCLKVYSIFIVRNRVQLNIP